MVAVDGSNACRLQLVYGRPNGDQIRMHQLDQRPAKQEIEPDKRKQGCRVVKHSAGRFFYFPAFHDEAGFQDLPEAAETAQRSDHFFQWCAPIKGRGVHIPEHGLHHLGHITKLNLLVINLRRGAQGEVLHQKKVNFVPVRIALLGFPQVPADERAQACFAGVQRSHLQEMTKLMGHHFLVHGVQPFVHLVEELNVGFLGEVPLALRKGNVDFRLLRKRHVNREDLARLFPLRKTRALRACRRRDI